MKMHKRQRGFTLLEIMIAMSVLAVGATSILSIFVLAVKYHSDRRENNRITELYNFALHHAEIAFANFDPARVESGKPAVPEKISADLTDPSKARLSADPLIREAADKFPNFRYEIMFDDNPAAVAGSSVVATIRIYRLSGQVDRQIAFMPEFLTRSGTPVNEYWNSPSLAKRDKERAAAGGAGKKKTGG